MNLEVARVGARTLGESVRAPGSGGGAAGDGYQKEKLLGY